MTRRTMAPLKRPDLVTSGGGVGSGWSLPHAIDSATVREVYQAIGSPTIFAIVVAVDHRIHVGADAESEPP